MTAATSSSSFTTNRIGPALPSTVILIRSLLPLRFWFFFCLLSNIIPSKRKRPKRDLSRLVNGSRAETVAGWLARSLGISRVEAEAAVVPALLGGSERKDETARPQPGKGEQRFTAATAWDFHHSRRRCGDQTISDPIKNGADWLLGETRAKSQEPLESSRENCGNERK